ncbi:hypothetical protein Zmor_023142 [Zophobas morio]|uniref:Uncharacterized protein n=1 Tax=Zophobas morio TaxID=2755281 RepID=A0AA38I021_9CUCU|nr:hypothetical protein Zmor_023142 [Zophobas morio]
MEGKQEVQEEIRKVEEEFMEKFTEQRRRSSLVRTPGAIQDRLPSDKDQRLLDYMASWTEGLVCSVGKFRNGWDKNNEYYERNYNEDPFRNRKRSRTTLLRVAKAF